MPTDEQIRELCARVLESSGPEFDSAIRDLQSAIRSRLEDLSNQAIATLLIMPRASSAQREANTAKTKTAAAGNEEDDQAS